MIRGLGVSECAHCLVTVQPVMFLFRVTLPSTFPSSVIRVARDVIELCVTIASFQPHSHVGGAMDLDHVGSLPCTPPVAAGKSPASSRSSGAKKPRKSGPSNRGSTSTCHAPGDRVRFAPIKVKNMWKGFDEKGFESILNGDKYMRRVWHRLTEAASCFCFDTMLIVSIILPLAR